MWSVYLNIENPPCLNQYHSTNESISQHPCLVLQSPRFRTQKSFAAVCRSMVRTPRSGTTSTAVWRCSERQQKQRLGPTKWRISWREKNLVGGLEHICIFHRFISWSGFISWFISWFINPSNYSWLVVWNMSFIFLHLVNSVTPIDSCFEGLNLPTKHEGFHDQRKEKNHR